LVETITVFWSRKTELGAEKLVDTGDFCGISGFAHFN